jgi:hypothetical protein
MSNLVMIGAKINKPEPGDIVAAAIQIRILAQNQARVNRNTSKQKISGDKVRTALARAQVWDRISADMQAVIAEQGEEVAYVDERTHVPQGDN